MVVLALVASSFVLVQAAPASALTSFVVNSTADLADATPGDGICDTGNTVGPDAECTLRAAVDETNTVGDPTDPVEIVLAPGATYELTQCRATGAQEDSNANGDLDFGFSSADTIAVTGNGATVRQTCPDERVLDDKRSSGIQLTIMDATLTGGNLITSGQGGGVYLIRPTVLDGVTVTQNSAVSAGGGAYAGNLGPGEFTVNNSTFLSNSSTASNGAGGAIRSDNVEIVGSTFTSNSAAQGGAVYASNGLAVADSVFDTNESTSHGGAVRVGSTFAITGSTFSDNTAGGYGGAVYGDGGGGLEVATSSFDNNTAGRGGALRVSNLTQPTLVEFSEFTNNTATTTGGAIDARDLTVNDSVFTGNSATTSIGGGIVASGAVEVARTTFFDNTASNGGAVRAGTVLTIIDSTISGNTSSGNGGAVDGVDVVIRNSTVSENAGTASATAGGVRFSTSLTLDHATIVANSVPDGAFNAGANIGRSGGSLISFGSVIADGVGGPDCGVIFGGVTSTGYNFDGDGSCGIGSGTGDVSNGGDPLLGPLQNNGGPILPHGQPTLTHAPLPGSQLIEAVPPGACVLATDQRGDARPAGVNCEIGSVELQVDPTLTKTADQTDVSIGSDVVFTIVALGGVVGPGGSTVTDALAPGLTYVSDDGDPADVTYDPGTNTVTWAVDNADTDLAITATVTVEGDITNTATIVPAGTDSDLSNNTSQITVTGVSTTPTALDDSYSVDEDSVLNEPAVTGVLDNDSDPELDPLDAVLDTPPAHGSLALELDGSFVYTPDPNFAGPDSFTYHAHDGSSGSNIATVSITVNPLPDAPVAVDDGFATGEDVALVRSAATGVLFNDTDGDGDDLTAVLVSDVANGVLVLDGDGSFVYTPETDYFGPDSFTYLVNDGVDDSVLAATVSITVNAVNDAPVAVDDDHSVDEDTDLVVAVPGVLFNDTDVEDDSLTAVLVSDVANGVLVLDGDGSFVYTPETDYFGPDSFTYLVNDGVDDSVLAATVSITVNAVNDPPVAADDTYDANENQDLAVPAPGVLGNDTDVDDAPSTLESSVVTPPPHGTLTLNLDGSFTYTPDTDYFGPDVFTYRVTDGDADSNDATVTVAVIASSNEGPDAVDDGYSVPEGTGQRVLDVLGNDTDLDGPLPIEIISNTQPANGRVDCGPSDCTYTGDVDFTGPVAFDYEITDGELTHTATVTIDVVACADLTGAFADSGIVTGYAWVECADAGASQTAGAELSPLFPPDGTSLLHMTTGIATDGVPGDSASTDLSTDYRRDVIPYQSVFRGAFDASVLRLDLNLPISVDCLSFDVVFATEEYEDGVPNLYDDGFLAELYVDDGTGDVASTWMVTGGGIDAPDNFASDNGEYISVAGAFFDAGRVITDTGMVYNAATARLRARTPVSPGAYHLYLSVFDGSDPVVDSGALIDSLQAFASTSCNPGVSEPSVAIDDAFTIGEDTATVLDVLGGTTPDFDPDGDDITILETALISPAGGSIVVAGDRKTLTYTPPNNFYGEATFEYSITDQPNSSEGEPVADVSRATVTVTIEERNDPPRAWPDGAAAPAGTATAIPVLDNDVDLDFDSVDPEDDIRIDSWTQPVPALAGASVTCTDADCTYTAPAGYDGPARFTYTIVDVRPIGVPPDPDLDARGDTSTATVYINTPVIVCDPATEDCVPPVADAGGPYEAVACDPAEGPCDPPLVLNGSGSSDDSGTIDRWQWYVYPNPPGTLVGASGSTPQFTTVQNGSFRAYLVVYDEAGNWDWDSTSISAFAADLTNPIDEGSSATINVDFFNPGGDLTTTIDWGDGSAAEVIPFSVFDPPLQRTHDYPQDSTDQPGGAYDVTVRIDGTTQDETIAVEDTQALVVDNAKPQVDAGIDRTLWLGDPRLQQARMSFMDPGDDSPWSATVDWGDGSPTESLTALDNGIVIMPQTHTYPSLAATYTVEICVSDDDEPGCDTFEVDVSNNQPPVAVIGGDASGEEGDLLALDASGSSDPDGDVASWDWSVIDPDGNVTITDPHTETPTFAAADEGDGTYEVLLQVCDDGGACSEVSSATITVTNADPVVDPGPNQIVDVGDTVTLAATFTDGGTLDTHTATIDWDDGNGPQPYLVTQGAGSGSVDESITYTTPGTHTVTVTVTDNDGGIGTDSFDVTVSLIPIPNDPEYPNQWWVDRINARTAWTVTTGSPDVVVAIVSSGKPDSHPDLDGINWWNECVPDPFCDGYDIVAGGNVSTDVNGRATELAGIIAAQIDNNIGGVSVAPDVTILPVRVQAANGNAFLWNVAAGVTWAAQHADVIMLDHVSYEYSLAVRNAIDAAEAQGVNVICPVGNDHSAIVGYPALNSDCFSVGATDRTDGLASFSNHGTGIELVAPGDDIVTATDPAYNAGAFYGSVSSTSAAAAQVAGAAALLKSRGATGAEVDAILAATAVDLGDPGYDTVYGYGRLDVAAALAAFTPATLASDPGGPYVGTEGTPTVLDGAGSTGVGTIVSHAWTTTGGSFDDATSATPMFIAPDDGTYTVTLTVTDDGGRSDSADATVDIANVEPLVDAGPDQTVRLGDHFDLTATFTDPGTSDTHTATVDWGGGGGPQPVVPTQGAGSGSIDDTFIYAAVGDFTVEVCVTDDDGNAPSLLAVCDSLTVTVDANDPPVLDPIGPQTVNELEQLTFTATATDPDIPPPFLTFSLEGAPPGAQINSFSGDFTWTPTEADGPGTFTFDVVVDDNGAPNEEGRETITVTVNEVNLPPQALTVTQYIGALGTGATAQVDPAFVTAAGSHTSQLIDFDGDGFDDLAPHTFRPIPTNTYAGQGVTLLNLDARSVEGQPTWTHSAPIGAWKSGFSASNQDPYSFVFDTPVASFGMFGQDVDGIVLATVHLVGGGNDTFELDRTPGSGANRFFGFTSDGNVITQIDFVSGDYHIIDDVQFGRIQPDSTTDYEVDEGIELSFTTAATDPDGPPTVLTFSLDGEPGGAAIDPATGLFSWTPTEADGPDVYTFDVVVTDDGVPQLEGRRTVTVTVNEVNDLPVADAGADEPADVGDLVTLDGSGSTDTDIPPQPLTYAWQFGTIPAGSAATLADPTTVTPSFTPDVGGSYTVELIVNDGIDESLVDTVTIVAIPQITGCSPGAVVWLGGDGNWSDPANWTSNPAVPGAADDVCIPAGVEATVDTDFEVNSMLSLGEVAVGSGAELTLNTTSQTSVLTLLGTIAGPGELTVDDSGDWSEGLIAGGVRIGPSATFTITGTSAKDLNGTLINDGLVTQAGSLDLYFDAINGVITNNATWQLADGAVLTFQTFVGVSRGSIVNNGLIHRLPAAASNIRVNIHADVINNGTISTAGWLWLYSVSEIHDGSNLHTDTPGILTLLNTGVSDAAPLAFGASSITGDGETRFEGMDLTIGAGAVVDAAGSDVSVQNVHGDGLFSITGAVDWTYGTITADVEVTGGRLDIRGDNGQTLTGDVTNDGSVWQQVPVNLSDAGASASIVNNSSWYLRTLASGTPTYGTLLSGDLTDPATFLNTGTLYRLNDGDPASEILIGPGVDVTTSGTVGVNSGGFAIESVEAIDGGTLEAGIGATLRLDAKSGGQVLASNDLELAGAGDIDWGDGFTTRANISGTNTLNLVEGTTSWTFGSIATDVYVAPGAVLAFPFNTNGFKYLTGTLTNDGVVNHAGSNLIMSIGTDAGTIINNGQWNLDSPENRTNITWDVAYGTFVNNGNLERNDVGGPSNFVIVDGVDLVNNGTVSVLAGELRIGATSNLSGTTLTGGRWIAQNGTLALPGPVETNDAWTTLVGADASIPRLSTLTSNIDRLDVLGGASLALTGDFTNNGNLFIGNLASGGVPSVLDVAGDFATTFWMRYYIGGPESAGFGGSINVGGLATLGGNLDFLFFNGYTPAIQESYQLMTYSSQTGSVLVSDQPAGFDVFVDPTEMRLAENDPDFAYGVVGPGGSVGTHTDVDATNPLAVSVTTPGGGAIEIAEQTPVPTAPPAGYDILGVWYADITAPAESATDPLLVTVLIDDTVWSGIPSDDVTPLRDGVAVVSCDVSGPAGEASPDPCVGARTVVADGNLEIVVRTSQASEWALGYPVTADLTVDFTGVENVRVDLYMDDGTPDNVTGPRLSRLTGQADSATFQDLPVGSYDVVLKKGGMIMIVDGVAVAGDTTLDGLVENLTVDLETLSGITLRVRTSDGTQDPGANVETLTNQSGVVIVEVLKGSYELYVKQKNAETIIDPIDCTTACDAGDLTSTLTVDLVTLTGITIEVRTSDGDPLVQGDLVQRHKDQSGVVAVQVLKGRYEIVVKQRKASTVIDPLDCTVDCSVSDLVQTLTIDLEGLTGVNLQLRTSDGSIITTGSRIATLSGQSGLVTLDVLSGSYEVVLKRGKAVLTIDPIDCTSDCDVGDVANTMTVDLGPSTNARVRVRAYDGVDGTVGGGVEWLTGQSGIVTLDVLKLLYDVDVRANGSTLVFDGVDCLEGGPCYVTMV